MKPAMQFFISLLSLLLASGYVLVLDRVVSSPQILQQSLVLPVLLVLLSLFFYRSSQQFLKSFTGRWGKPFMLFWGTAFIQLLLLSTGGENSQRSEEHTSELH